MKFIIKQEASPKDSQYIKNLRNQWDLTYAFELKSLIETTFKGFDINISLDKENGGKHIITVKNKEDLK